MYIKCIYLVISLVILLYCTIVILIKRKNEGLQGSVAHVSALVYPLHWESMQVDVV